MVSFELGKMTTIMGGVCYDLQGPQISLPIMQKINNNALVGTLVFHPYISKTIGGCVGCR